jgi:hypothetical protein
MSLLGLIRKAVFGDASYQFGDGAKVEAVREVIRAAVADGVVTADELSDIEAKCEELGLSPTQITKIKGEAYSLLVNTVSGDRRVTEGEQQSLNRLIAHFNIPSDVVARSRRELDRYSLLFSLEQGYLPDLDSDLLILKKGEILHWQFAASVLEDKVIKREWVGRSSGFSFRISKGVSYNVGASRGRLVAQNAVVPVSSGTVALTNQRFAYVGNTKSLEFKWNKLLAVEMFTDGFMVSTSNRQKPVVFRVSNAEQMDVVGMILSSIVNKGD